MSLPSSLYAFSGLVVSRLTVSLGTILFMFLTVVMKTEMRCFSVLEALDSTGPCFFASATDSGVMLGTPTWFCLKV